MQSLDPITPITGCTVEQHHFIIFQRSTVTRGAPGLHEAMEKMLLERMMMREEDSAETGEDTNQRTHESKTKLYIDVFFLNINYFLNKIQNKNIYIFIQGFFTKMC